MVSFFLKYIYFGDGLVIEDNFFVDIKGECFLRFFEGDGVFFVWDFLCFLVEFSFLFGVLFLYLVFFLGDFFFDFFEVDFLDDLGGLFFFLKKSGESNFLNELS